MTLIPLPEISNHLHVCETVIVYTAGNFTKLRNLYYLTVTKLILLLQSMQKLF